MGLEKDDTGDEHRCPRGRGRCLDCLGVVGTFVSISQMRIMKVRKVRQSMECPAHPGLLITKLMHTQISGPLRFP